MSTDAAGLRVLTTNECLHLLSTVSVGRIALSHRALPMILPVHFRMLDRRIVVHTTPGTTLFQATDGTVVAFEAEGPAGAVDPRWSVVVHGVATHPESRDRFTDRSRRRVEISVDQVTGRDVLDTSDPMAPIRRTSLTRW